jgi:lysozyme family protein
MTDPFPALVARVIGEEGGYTDAPTDRGGPTNWGVTEAQARAAGYAGDMRSMRRDQAVEIYRVHYWVEPHFDLIGAAWPAMGDLLFELGVNLGPMKAGAMLQRALNGLRVGAGVDLQTDGVCGPLTRAALSAYRARRGAPGDAVLIDAVRALAAVRYLEIAEGDRSQREYLFGWWRNRAFEVGAAAA